MPLAETLREIRRLLGQLELVSHVSAVNLDPLPPRTADESPGGKRPSGGVRRGDDRERGFALKSPDHFRRRLAGARSERAFESILADLRASLGAHKRQPAPTGRPKVGEVGWKRWASESPLPASEVARLSGCSRRYVEKVRKQYR